MHITSCGTVGEDEDVQDYQTNYQDPYQATYFQEYPDEAYYEETELNQSPTGTLKVLE